MLCILVCNLRGCDSSRRRDNDAEGNYRVDAARPTKNPYVVDVERIPSSHSEPLRKEVLSAIKGKESRIFVYAGGYSRTHSFVTELEALAETGLCDLSIILRDAGRKSLESPLTHTRR